MKISTFFLVLIVIFSCNSKKEPQQVRMTEQEVTERLTNANKHRVQKESEEIEEFIKQHKFSTERT